MKASKMRLFLLIFFLSFYAHAELKTAQTGFSNKLIAEGSPYLQQHAHNPVHWYPWGKEALQKAKDEHKPIFLSIGYSTCHWCHVMAHESFEDEAIASLINRDYIAIKVDREELPHLDKYYQNLHLLLKKRSGGWPLTAILTETSKPFFVATYLPPTAKYNIEGLDTFLPRTALEYKNKRSAFISKAEIIESKMKDADRAEFKPVKIELSIVPKIYEGLMKEFDDIYYGFSIQPKFPESSKIGLLFDLDALGLAEARQMALKTLRAMALHGLYDQVEGGFFRYSTDAAWEIPHFEKMLYTNAELVPLYVKAYELTQDELYRQVVVETIAMIEHRFEDQGVYMSASDADSAHEEGGYFIYSYEEMTEAMASLSVQEKEELEEVLEVSIFGNFEGKTHINFYDEKRPENFKKIRDKLYKIRQNREYPFIDTKINTAWNAMMIEALFSASTIDQKYLKLAQKRVRSLLENMYIKGILYHQSLPGSIPVQKALLEDYAYLISALIEGYQHNYNAQYLFLAQKLSDEAIEKFYDGKFWYLNESEEFRVYAGMQDKYYQAPMNKMLSSLLRLASLSGERKYLSLVEKSLKVKSSLLQDFPSRYPSAMQVLLRAKKGYVILKATKQGLLQVKDRPIDYPFVLRKVSSEIKGYLACDMEQCFAVDKVFENVIKSIETR
jgi:uncharacterized protein YyaL (SSP411 family)